MKNSLIIGILFLVSNVFAGVEYPQVLKLSGVAHFEEVSQPVVLSLNLDQVKVDKVKYEGQIQFATTKKSYVYDVDFKLNLMKNRIEGRINANHDIIFEGPLTELNSGAELVLAMKQYRTGPEHCYRRRGEEWCTPGRDELVDSGTMNIIIE